MKELTTFIEKESTMDLQERNLFLNFMEKFPHVLRRSLPVKTIEDGYRGIVPFDPVTLLKQCTSWEHFASAEQQSILPLHLRIILISTMKWISKLRLR